MVGNDDQTQGQARRSRGKQNRGDPRAGHSDRKRGTRGAGAGAQPQPVGVSGAAGEGAATVEIVGGILSRMIADKKERLREVRATIVWYQEEEQKRLEELADLENLAAQIETDENPDIEIS